MNTTTLRRITKQAQLDGQGLTAGHSYQIIKANIVQRPGYGVVSAAWIWDEQGTIREIKNAHLAFDLEA